MSLFEYLATIVAIVLGLAAANLLNKFSDAILNTEWKSIGWFFCLWCLILLICLLGYFWAFWRIYSGIEMLSIWEFIYNPFASVVCLFLISVFLPVPDKHTESAVMSEHFMAKCKPFYVTLALLWLHFGIAPLFVGFEQSPLEVAFAWLMIVVSTSGIFLKSFEGHKFVLVAFTSCYLGQEVIQLAISS